MAAAEKGASKIRPIRKSSVSPYSWRAGRADGARLGAPEGAEMALIKQKAAISPSIFRCEMLIFLYGEDNLDPSDF